MWWRWWSFKARTGQWAAARAGAYYRTHNGTFKGLPRYIEILANWPDHSWRRRWVKTGMIEDEPRQ